MTAHTVTGKSPWPLGIHPGERLATFVRQDDDHYVIEVDDAHVSRPPSEFDGIPLTCDTCNGAGKLPGIFDGRGGDKLRTCPECVGGAPIIDLQVERVYGYGYDSVRASVHAALIVKYGEHDTVGRYVVTECEPGSRRAFLMNNGDGFPVEQHEITLPDGAEVGHWAIIAVEVPS